MVIEITKNNRGDYTAEINLNKHINCNITGGTLYAYGDTEKEAKDNLLTKIQDVIEALEKIY